MGKIRKHIALKFEHDGCKLGVGGGHLKVVLSEIMFGDLHGFIGAHKEAFLPT